MSNESTRAAEIAAIATEATGKPFSAEDVAELAIFIEQLWRDLDAAGLVIVRKSALTGLTGEQIRQAQESWAAMLGVAKAA